MKIANYISNIEHKSILTLSFSAFSFSILSFFAYLIISHNNQVSYEQSQLLWKVNGGSMFSGPYCQTDNQPLFLFGIILLTGITFLALHKAKKLYPIFLLINTSFLFFIYWFFHTLKIINLNEGELRLKGSELILYKSSIFDFIVLFCVSILFFWQISFLLRLLIKSLQRKKLP